MPGYRLPQKLIAGLGIESDASLARRFGIDRKTISNHRRRRGIKRAPLPLIELSREHEKLLGKISDQAVGKLAGVSFDVIRRCREVRKIKPLFKRAVAHQWTPEELEMLGNETDQAIGKVLGMSSAAVAKKRRSLGIAAYCESVGARGIEWSASMLADLGRIPDAKIARRYGIGVSAVATKRRSLGIPTLIRQLPSTQEALTDLKTLRPEAVATKYGIRIETVLRKRRKLGLPSKKGIWWSRKTLAALGTKSDKKIAAELVMAESTVNMKRRELGVPSFKSKHRTTDRVSRKMPLR